MKEIQSIVSKYDELKDQGHQLALAMVVHVEQSSYRRSGARMLISSDGTWTGGISGGCLEGDILKKAKLTILEGKPTAVRYDTREDDPSQIGVGLGCRGIIDVLITPINADNKHNGIEVLRSTLDRRDPSLLITFVKYSAKAEVEGMTIDLASTMAFVGTNPSITAGLKQGVSEVIAGKKSKKIIVKEAADEQIFFIECILPKLKLFVFGKNYDTIPLCQLAKSIGWKTIVCAPPLKISKELFDSADEVLPADKAYEKIDEYSACLLMAHDYNTDKNNLRNIAISKALYIGILGPKKRSDRIKAELVTEELELDYNKIFAPVGLDTGATTPEEIAISILAEIRTVFQGRGGGHLKDRDLPINDIG